MITRTVRARYVNTPTQAWVTHTEANTHTEVRCACVSVAGWESRDPTTKFSRTLDCSQYRRVQAIGVTQRHTQWIFRHKHIVIVKNHSGRAKWEWYQFFYIEYYWKTNCERERCELLFSGLWHCTHNLDNSGQGVQKHRKYFCKYLYLFFVVYFWQDFCKNWMSDFI